MWQCAVAHEMLGACCAKRVVRCACGEPFGSGGRGGKCSEGRAQGGGPWQKARRSSSVSGVAGDYEGDGRLNVRVSMGRGLASR